MIRSEARCSSFLEETRNNLGIDLDSYRPQHELLRHLLNARTLARETNSTFSLKEKNGGYHVQIGIPSSLELRRILGDDPKRIRSAEIRSTFGLPVADILFSTKSSWHVESRRGKRVFISQKGLAYEECDLSRALALPFCSLCPSEARA
jgi:hypothetical protein